MEGQQEVSAQLPAVLRLARETLRSREAAPLGGAWERSLRSLRGRSSRSLNRAVVFNCAGTEPASERPWPCMSRAMVRLERVGLKLV